MDVSRVKGFKTMIWATLFCRQSFFALAVIGLFLGCDNSTTSVPKPAAASKISVLVTAYPMVEMIKRIGGEQVDVQWLVESGQRPEDIDLGPDLRQRASKAALVVTSGPWDTWAVSELNADARSARVLEPGRTTAGRQVDPKSYPWLDASVMLELIEKARIRLTILDPNHETDYRNNAAAYQTEIQTIDKEIRAGLNKVAARQVLAVRPGWGALCKRYGLSLLIPIETTEEKLTPDNLKQIARLAKANGIKSIFVDSATSAAVRQQIEEKTGLKTVELDALGSSADDGRNTWGKVMRFDLEQLKKGLE